MALGTDEPHSPLLLTDDAGMSTRGNPDTIGTAILPLESTVIDVQVCISISLVPDEYPLPPKYNVYEDPDDPALESTVMTGELPDPFFIANVWLS